MVRIGVEMTAIMTILMIQQLKININGYDANGCIKNNIFISC